MAVKGSVFGSKSERKQYEKLKRTWGDKYDIYHNLPFLNVFSIENELRDYDFNPITLTEDEKDYLKKASIDFVLCEKKTGKPILCIEFDGMQDGFNHGHQYLKRDNTKGRQGRKKNMETKLKVGLGSMFPFFILGTTEFKGLSDSVKLTIADGIIGDVLASIATREEIDKGFTHENVGLSESEWDNLSEAEQQEHIQDWVWNIELESMFKHNPILKRVGELWEETGSRGEKYSFLEEDQIGIDKERWSVVRCTVENYKYGDESVLFQMPNFNSPHCFFSITLAMEIGKLLAVSKIKAKMKDK